jgi:hypothetical protein
MPSHQFVKLGSDLINLSQIAYAEWEEIEGEKEKMQLKVITGGGEVIRVTPEAGKAQALYARLEGIAEVLDLPPH